MKIITRTLFVISSICFFGESAAKPAGHFFLGDPINIPITTNNTNLAFEIGGIDITSTTVVSGQQAHIQTGTILGEGKYELLVYRLTGDNVELLQTHQIELQEKPSQQRAELTKKVSINGQKDIEYGGEMNGNAVINGKWRTDDWLVSANANLTFNTADSYLTEQEKVDLNSYLLNIKRGNLTGNLGHHSITKNNLVLNNFSRRGLSVDWKKDSYEFTGFVLNSMPLTGFSNLSGINRSNTQVRGFSFDSKPFARYGNDLGINITWAHGKKSTISNSSLVSSLGKEEGSAASIQAYTKAINNRLELNAQYAKSWDRASYYNKTKSEFADDSAYKLKLSYRLITPDWANKKTSQLTAGVEYRSVGTFYRSLANQGVPPDQKGFRSFLAYSNKGLSTQVGFENLENNVADIQQLPTTSNNRVSGSLNYSLQQNGRIPTIFGQPIIGISWHQSEMKHIYTPVGYSNPLDMNTWQTTLSTDFIGDKWRWGLNYSTGEIEDNYNDLNNSENQLIGARLNLQPSDRNRLGLNFQYNTQTVNGRDIKRFLTTLNGKFEIIRDRLSVDGSISWTRQNQSYYSPQTAVSSIAVMNSRQILANVGLNWHFSRELIPLNTRLWLKAQYQDNAPQIVSNNLNNGNRLMIGFSTDID